MRKARLICVALALLAIASPGSAWARGGHGGHGGTAAMAIMEATTGAITEGITATIMEEDMEDGARD